MRAIMNKLFYILALVIILLLIAVTIAPALSISYGNGDSVVSEHKLMLKYGNN